MTNVFARSFNQVGRLAAGALSFLALSAACAEGTNTDDPTLGPPVEGTSGTTSGGDGGRAGAPMAGSSSTPVAGKSSTGGGGAAGTGGKPSGASGTGGGGKGGTAGTGGSSSGAAGMAGSGGVAGSAAGSGGSGGSSSGGGGVAGSGGSGPTGFRYAKLVATSELNGRVWSSVAELQIMTTGNVALSRTGWTVTADSQETVDQTAPATAAIDGDNATFWHTAWAPPPDDGNDAKLPHSLTIDLKTTQAITGFSYLPRQNNQNGRIKDWQFFVSKDGTSWGTAVKTGSFPTGTVLQTVTF